MIGDANTAVLTVNGEVAPGDATSDTLSADAHSTPSHTLAVTGTSAPAGATSANGDVALGDTSGDTLPAAAVTVLSDTLAATGAFTITGSA